MAISSSLSPLPPPPKTYSLQKLRILLEFSYSSFSSHVGVQGRTIRPHQQLGLAKCLLVDSISDLTDEVILTSWEADAGAGAKPRAKETVLRRGRQPGPWCPWQGLLSGTLAGWFSLLLLAGWFLLFIRCFNFTKHARDLGFGIFISSFSDFVPVTSWLPESQSTNK